MSKGYILPLECAILSYDLLFHVNFQNTVKFLVMISSLVKRSQVRVGSHQGGALVIYVGPITGTPEGHES